jgi:glycosyltransferase involved in cell wall biosynthesis
MLGGPALKISRLKKRVFWMLLQRAALEAADCLHATATAEYEEIRSSGLVAPVAIIPNGIDIPDILRLPRPSGRMRTILSLGRIHPKKGLDRLVYAWANLEREFPDWNVRIVGPAERRHDSELRSLAAHLGLQRLTIEEPVYDELKTAIYRVSDLFVLPTLNENFAVTVAEALAAEVPVIATNGAPWAGLETERCGWWIEQGVEALEQALARAMRLPRSELNAMGASGRRWMVRDFGWDKVAREMSSVYSWLIHGGPPPPTVRLH